MATNPHNKIKMSVVTGNDKRVSNIKSINFTGKKGESYDQQDDIDMTVVGDSKGEIDGISDVNMIGADYTNPIQSTGVFNKKLADQTELANKKLEQKKDTTNLIHYGDKIKTTLVDGNMKVTGGTLSFSGITLTGKSNK